MFGALHLKRGDAKATAQARALFERACSAGDASGCTALGALHVRGPDEIRDPPLPSVPSSAAASSPPLCGSVWESEEDEAPSAPASASMPSKSLTPQSIAEPRPRGPMDLQLEDLTWRA
jgi:TPR repeat protein